MNTATIQEQIDIIKRATEKALQSKEETLKFLVNAGIIKLEKDKQNLSKERKARKKMARQYQLKNWNLPVSNYSSSNTQHKFPRLS
jgi:hypothetical protein